VGFVFIVCPTNHSHHAYDRRTANRVEAVVRSLVNMASANIAAVDFNKITSLDRPAACGHVRWGRSASQSMGSNASVLIEHI